MSSTSSRPSSRLSGPLTFRTTSAPANSAFGSATTSAPTSRYSSSECDAARPAPASTTNCIFSEARRLIADGDMATRRSPGARSFGTTIRMVIRSMFRVRCLGAPGARPRSRPCTEPLQRQVCLTVVQSPIAWPGSKTDALRFPNGRRFWCQRSVSPGKTVLRTVGLGQREPCRRPPSGFPGAVAPRPGPTRS